MSVNYTVQLTTGDSTGTYSLYFHTGSTYNTAVLMSNGNPATGITLSQLLSGVSIVIDDDSDEILVVNLGDCKNSIIFPITPQVPPTPDPNLCMTFIFDGSTYSFSFTPNGTENGKTKWEYFDGTTTYKISWNPRVSNTGSGSGRWEMTFIGGLVFTTLNVSNLPDSGWYATGTAAALVLNLQVAQGTCSGTPPLNADVIATNTTCKNTTPCNGAITVYPVGGSGVYQYSINGLGYQQSNIFNGLCENTYLVNIKDSNNSLLQLNATVGYDSVPKTYNATIAILNQSILINRFNPRRRVVQTDWELQFDNTIDVGTTINFNMAVSDTQTINGPGSGTISAQTLVYLNSVLQVPLNTRASTYVNPRAFCSGENVTGTSIITNYVLSVTNSSRVTGTTISDTLITNPSVNSAGCTTLLSNSVEIQNTLNPQNPITGCQCCTVNFSDNASIIYKDVVEI
jgi:hypothetical protein